MKGLCITSHPVLVRVGTEEGRPPSPPLSSPDFRPVREPHTMKLLLTAQQTTFSQLWKSWWLDHPSFVSAEGFLIEKSRFRMLCSAVPTATGGMLSSGKAGYRAQLFSRLPAPPVVITYCSVVGAEGAPGICSNCHSDSFLHSLTVCGEKRNGVHSRPRTWLQCDTLPFRTRPDCSHFYVPQVHGGENAHDLQFGILHLTPKPSSFFLFLNAGSHSCNYWHGSHSTDQAGLELRELPTSASQVLKLKACTTTPSLSLLSLVFLSERNVNYCKAEKFASRTTVKSVFN